VTKDRVNAALYAREEAQKDWNNYVFERKLAERGKFKKTVDFGAQLLNLSKAIMTSTDASFLLKQGLFALGPAVINPKKLAQIFGHTLKSLKSEKNQHAAMQSIRDHPLYQEFLRSDTYLSDMNTNDVNKMEEAFFSKWVPHIKGWKGALAGAAAGGLKGATFGPQGAAAGAAIGGFLGAVGAVPASQRAFVTFLNLLRFNAFVVGRDFLGMNGRIPIEDAKALGNAINVFTGRGKIGFGKKSMGSGWEAFVLNAFLFAPRLLASQFNMLFGQPLYGGSMRAKTYVASMYASGFAFMFALYGIFAMMKDDEDETPMTELDPKSSDFLKLRMENTRLDFSRGLLPTLVYLTRFITGETTPIGADEPVALADNFRPLEKVREWRGLPQVGDKPSGGKSRLDLSLRFWRSKLSPVAGAVAAIMDDKDFLGRETTAKKEIDKMVVPMGTDTYVEALVDVGFPRGAAISIAAFFGASAQTHEMR
jgi:hypothetical protein